MNDIVHQLRQASFSNEDCRWKAADEITYLRAINASLLDILDSRYDQLYNLQAEVKRLNDENFSLAAWQCEFTDGKTGLVASEGGNTYCAMAKEVERLRAVMRVLKVGLNGLADSEDAAEIADAIVAGEVIDWDRYPPATRAVLEGK